MKKTLITALWTFLLCAASLASAGVDEANKNLRRQPYFDLQGRLIASNVVPGFYALHPNFNEANPLKGMVLGVNEVGAVMSAQKGGHIRLNQQQSALTSDEQRAWRIAVMKGMNTDGLITYKFGAGDRKLYLITAYDCSYCAALEKRLAKLAPKLNATVYMVPIILNPSQDAAAMYNAIACSSDPAAQWRAALTLRSFPKKAVPACGAPSLVDTTIAAIALGELATPALIQEDGSKASGIYSSDDTALIRTFTLAGRADLQAELSGKLRDLTVGGAFAETVGLPAR